MIKIRDYQFWFVTGSQHLYGEEALDTVEEHSKIIVNNMNDNGELSHPITFKSVLTNANDIHKLMLKQMQMKTALELLCGCILFSPAKIWIAGLKALQKPILHFHTQYNEEIPWDKIDMDFMNLNQSAHGDREFGFMGTRLEIARKVVVGYWENSDVLQQISSWMKSAVAVVEGTNIRVARFGDNMRNVAVTDGDKIEAQIKFGWSVDYYGIGDLVEVINQISDAEAESLFEEYQALYNLPEDVNTDESLKEAILEQARIELALKKFLSEKGYTAFTTNFEDLHGMKQLPGLAAQRLMAEGYGFAGEGDWRTAALLRMMKIIADNKETSFMEDYTYHLEKGNELILGSHMLEICPTIAQTKPKILVKPLSMGDKADPARLVFDGKAGEAIVASLVELGGRYRLVINEVEAVDTQAQTPNLPVAKVLWKPQPSFREATESWIYAGGAHHTVMSFQVTAEQLFDFAMMANIECIIIDSDTNVRQLRSELMLSEKIW